MTPRQVPRHQAAIRRTEYSRPIRIALETKLIESEASVLDFGCGQGDDVRRLQRIGIACVGWDPHFRPQTAKKPSDIVNLGFVLNVIEDPSERAEVLQEAWDLANRVLLVATRPTAEAPTETGHRFRDGILTSRGTFQKFYDQIELRDWVEAQLSVPAVSVEPGIVFVFRSESDRHDFLLRRVRRSSRRIRVREADLLYEAHREACDALLSFYADRGRGPRGVVELPEVADLVDEVGTTRQAVHVVRRLIGRAELERLREEARNDLLVYLALDRFGKRPRFGELPEALRWDIRSHFSSYRKACELGDRLLFATGNAMLIDAECRDAEVGKLTPQALYVHRTALADLSPELRVYEGCARALVGDIPEATLIKLGRREPVVSYLSYPTFDKDPHPALSTSYTVKFRSLKATFRDYRQSENPPILHRKETFVGEDYPGIEKFARLTKQEEQKGLLEDTARIGTRDGWNSVLDDAGVTLRGHRVVRSG